MKVPLPAYRATGQFRLRQLMEPNRAPPQLAAQAEVGTEDAALVYLSASAASATSSAEPEGWAAIDPIGAGRH